MKKTLVIFAHPDVEHGSIANRIILSHLSKMAGVEIRDLHKMYPDFKIDRQKEQKALLGADLIIFQFPFYWYSTPGILKQWQDEVLTYGFAYGSAGNKLDCKEFVVSTTIGGPAESYCSEGFNNFTVDELLKPLEQMANLAGMKFNRPIISHNMIYIPDVYNKADEVAARAEEHAKKLVAFIEEKSC
ncbi:MAG: NAD(P)H-dependent oxidoreductase [Proteobacteria bacterium]|nr:NAD(P)H-dependent oxidoreductase [Pseudomonadota bacterium]MBU1739295.1 NAD(P)H-dependent oxidoreductase [Pseudomonadota bacterium]